MPSLENIKNLSSDWIYLSGAIFCEVIATSALKASNGFTVLIPSIFVIVGYIFTYYFLSMALRTIPIGIAYAVWSGVGLVFVSLIAYFYYKQELDLTAYIGMMLIATGVFILNVYSNVHVD